MAILYHMVSTDERGILMLELALCLLMALFLLAEFMIFGVGIQKIFRLDFRKYEVILTGFFVYFGIFQIVALPMILLQRPFHELTALWVGFILLANIILLFWARRELWKLAAGICRGFWQAKGIALLCALLIIGFTCYFHSAQQYLGWDTSYYIGTVNTTVYTDSMYVFDGADGTAGKFLNLRYALSSFYMHSAILCRLASMNAIIVQKYVIGTICILVHALILFSIGKRLFGRESKKALSFLFWGMFLNYGFNTIYTTSSFLLLRAYEAKGFCANVVIPAIFYAAICLWESQQKREHWWMLFFFVFASVPLSMSSIFIAPVLTAILLAAEWLIRRDWRILWRGFWCVVPNGLYLAVYFLYTQGYRIAVH